MLKPGRENTAWHEDELEGNRNPMTRMRKLRSQARKELPKQQFKEIKEEINEIHREIEREQIQRHGRMNLDTEKVHDFIPAEHDSDDEILYQPSRREPTFELDDDLEPRPIGGPPRRRKHTARGWSEKWYKNNDVDYSDSDEDYSSDWSQYDASDEERDDIPNDEDYRRAMSNRDVWRERWRKRDLAEEERRRAERDEDTAQAEKEGDMVDKAAKVAGAAKWFAPGFVSKLLLGGVELLGTMKSAWYDDKIVMPKSAKGTVFEPAFKAAKMYYDKPYKRKATYDDDDPVQQWKDHYSNPRTWSKRGHRRRRHRW
jgi:hypothetical protein